MIRLLFIARYKYLVLGRTLCKWSNSITNGQIYKLRQSKRLEQFHNYSTKRKFVDNFCSIIFGTILKKWRVESDNDK